MAKISQGDDLYFHVNSTDMKDQIYIFIPKELWGMTGVSDAVKRSIDLTFADETEETRQ